MNPRARLIAAIVLLLAFAYPRSPARAVDPRTVRVAFQSMSTGISAPTAIATASDGSGRIYVAEQAGRIRVRIPRGMINAPYLDIRDRVLDGGERGLLGIAFHPRYFENGRLYVTYTDNQGDLRVSRFNTTPGSFTAPASSEVILLDIPHRDASNHNGGSIAFGKDGLLYVGTGDGGGGGDPNGNGQRLTTLLGKVLRIDVNRTCGSLRYCIPSSNPFASSSSSARKEIFFWGLRNPWRVTFDRRDGPIWIADVGQNAREELNTFSAGVGGKNLGWDCREGTLNTVSTYGGSYCSGKTFTPPLWEYGHSGGRCSVTGGYVYRGSTYSSVMGGVYLYADYCTGEVFGIARQPDRRLVSALLYDHGSEIPSFGEAPNGELYAVDAGGTLWRVTASRR